MKMNKKVNKKMNNFKLSKLFLLIIKFLYSIKQKYTLEINIS